jgi:hypothetical protein
MTPLQRIEWGEQVAYDENLPPSASGIAAVLAGYVNGTTGIAMPGLDTIAARARVTKKTARDVTRAMEARGHLKVKVGGGRGGCNSYRLILDPALAPPERGEKGCSQGDPFPEKGRSQGDPLEIEKGVVATPKGCSFDAQRVKPTTPEQDSNRDSNSDSPSISPHKAETEPLEEERENPPDLFEEQKIGSSAIADRHKGSSRREASRSRLPVAVPNDVETDEFETFYRCYPKKVGKGEAQRVWKRARKLASLEEVLAGVERYTIHMMVTQPHDGDRERYTKHPSTWLNGRCWLDEYNSHPPSRRGGPIDIMALANVGPDYD